MRSRIQLRPAAIVALCVAVTAPLAWVASDAIERNNDTCTACHIGEVPLHQELRRDFDARPPGSLAGLHAALVPELRIEDPVMRCFDCHGGASFVGRVRVKYLAVRDGVIWLAGQGSEPSEMDHPLWDEDCVRCHAEYHPRVDDQAPPPFHALSVHNTGTGFDCVDCHVAHARDVDPDFHFLDVPHVQTRCAHCHSEFEKPREM
jgi:hypothetical protein